MPRYDAAWIASMLDPARERATRPRELLAEAGVGSGTRVLDYGCGPGFFAIPAAELVADSGRVAAVDREPRMLDEVKRRAPRAETMAPEDAARLPDDSFDVAIAGLLLHDLDGAERADVLRELRRLARRLLVVEWTPKEPRPNRIPPEELRDLLRRHGFSPGEPRALGPDQYAVIA